MKVARADILVFVRAYFQDTFCTDFCVEIRTPEGSQTRFSHGMYCENHFSTEIVFYVWACFLYSLELWELFFLIVVALETGLKIDAFFDDSRSKISVGAGGNLLVLGPVNNLKQTAERHLQDR